MDEHLVKKSEQSDKFSSNAKFRQLMVGKILTNFSKKVYHLFYLTYGDSRLD